ncbi:MAG: hypothetical protein H0W55_10460 [Actinobacteria bacterium]|nr:hypothetical protein [Actinomycetota bacterium]MDQ3530958.1 hypothetical protein [Actinomycetota bacterium]
MAILVIFGQAPFPSACRPEPGAVSVAALVTSSERWWHNVLTMSDRSLIRLAWATYGLAAGALVGALSFLVFFLLSGVPWDAGRTVGAVLFFIFPTVGVLVAVAQPRNPIGWILLGIGADWGLLFVADPYIWYAYVAEPGSLWRPDLVVALTSSMWIPAVGLMGSFLILLFPNGRLLSGRWRAFAWVSGINLAVQFVVTLFIPRTLRDISSNPDVPRSPNPLGIQALEPVVGAWELGVVLIALSLLVSAVSLMLRFRRSRGRERLQLKWMATAGAGVAIFFLFFLLTNFLTHELKVNDPLVSLSGSVLSNAIDIVFPLIPIAMGIAILKHRLYDIDIIINRALVYGVLTTLLASVYVAGVVGMGGLVRGLGGDSDNSLVIAATTLLVAGLFGPARARIQRFIDRRFYRHKYDAVKTVESFSARLRDEIDLDELCMDLVETVTSTMQPARVSVWLRPVDPPR